MNKQIECPFCGSKVIGDAGDTDHHNVYKCWDCDSLFEQNIDRNLRLMGRFPEANSDPGVDRLQDKIDKEIDNIINSGDWTVKCQLKNVLFYLIAEYGLGYDILKTLSIIAENLPDDLDLLREIK